jgi:hypothetical protein
MFGIRCASVMFVAAAAFVPGNAAQSAQISAETGQAPQYAATVDRILASPVLLDATITRATRLKGADIVGVAPGWARFYVEAQALALIRGPAGLPARFAYVADVPLDARGKAPRLRKTRVLLFARTVPGQPGAIRLTAPDAQQPWTPAYDALVRRIASELVAPDAPPAIVRVGNAFHVPGALPGEGETQIFLITEDSRPVSLSVLRRPGEQPRWAVALSEIVDDAARPPERDTLLWYRLACGLPRSLPDASLAQLSPEDAAKAREDYRFVLESLGSCGRPPNARG